MAKRNDRLDTERVLTFESVITDFMPFIDTRFRLEIQLGSATMTIRELLDLDVGSLVELKKSAGEPMEVLCKGRPVMRGRGDRAGGFPGPADRGDHRLPPQGVRPVVAPAPSSARGPLPGRPGPVRRGGAAARRDDPGRPGRPPHGRVHRGDRAERPGLRRHPAALRPAARPGGPGAAPGAARAVGRQAGPVRAWTRGPSRPWRSGWRALGPAVRIWDPVLAPTSGVGLHSAARLRSMAGTLLGAGGWVVTPNLPEAQALAGARRPGPAGLARPFLDLGADGGVAQGRPRRRARRWRTSGSPPAVLSLGRCAAPARGAPGHRLHPGLGLAGLAPAGPARARTRRVAAARFLRGALGARRSRPGGFGRPCFAPGAP